MSDIVIVPNAVLRQIAKPVTKIDKRILGIVDDMIKTLEAAKDPEGVGLAAPQVGLSLRLFVIKPTKRSRSQVFVNPIIVKISKKLQKGSHSNGVYEGCLSIPNHYAPLDRSYSITISYQHLDGSQQTEAFTGFPAHIIQHEIDHLNGILFIDHVLSQNSKLFKVKGRKWDEVQI